ncbi:uncharacterized protein GGS22DRAFT_192209 [Annulohypoxylon maeteangense]|uniref:uncharacterized protein n=1 Tax=Annulohypoxylon maeteangense TaxID=1927788 RepID=UPI002007BD2B|nr:uncharacterized protein GGS22DRAFT_192209 [Annulohypoxylon maeteangense]KAI0881574.1 hypothetical protein GGS22DRAFT_192209 [Annulohypoxylon maeteangense]
MDPLNNRGRGRKRHTSHISPPPSSPSQNVAQDLPDLPSASDTSGPLAPLPFSFEASSPSASLSTRMRTRQVEGINSSPGGRSLRKRPRVDYTFEQQLDVETSPKLTQSASRSIKRRRTDAALNENELDDDPEARSEARSKRRASEQPQSSSTRRRNTGKGPAEPQAFEPTHHDDVDVQDTIEVGGHHSEESDESLIRRTNSGSSGHDTKPAPGSASSDSAGTQSSPCQQSPPTSKASLLSQPLPLPPYHPVPGESVSKEFQERVQVNVSKEANDEANFTKKHPPGMGHDQDGPGSSSHLTPYIKGTYVFYPEYLEDDPEPDADPDRDSFQVDAEVDLNTDADTNLGLDRTTATNGHNSEDAAVNDKMDGLVEETPADTAANSPSGEAEATVCQPSDKKQFRFDQTRSASEFTDMFQDIKSLSTAELYRRLEIANEAMVAWQEEFRELKKITDDYDNAVRYQKEEEAFLRRSNMMTSRNPASNPIAKDFVVKGERAQDNTDPLVKYQRQQDKIMASAYGFEYDPRPDKIGNQDPIAQRTGAGRQGRLRERPKQTAKAAELDDPIVVQGKRTRKAPERFAGDEVISRGSTPVPSTQRRGRRNNLAPENSDPTPPQPQSRLEYVYLPQALHYSQAKGPQPSQSSQSEPQSQAPSSSFSSSHTSNTSHTNTEAQDTGVSVRDHIPAPEYTENEVPKKKGKGGRPRKNHVPESAAEFTTAPQPRPEPESEPEQSQALPETRKSPIQRNITKIVFLKTQGKPGANSQNDPQSAPESSTKREREGEEVDEEQPTRKRRRRVSQFPSTSGPSTILAPPPAPTSSVTEENDIANNGTESQTPIKPTRRRISKNSDVASGPTDIASSTSFTAPAEEPRPRTASSTATADTVTSTSNYQLREKRQRKFTNDITDDDFVEEPKRKRARRTPKKPQAKKEDILPIPQPPLVQRPEPEAPTLPKPPPKIKIKSKPGPLPTPFSTSPSSAPSFTPSTNLPQVNMNTHVNGNTNGNGNVVGNGTSRFDAADAESRAEPPKDYSTMTKSEKMSASMKARWASGSMGGAVIKRRATLAAKKQSVKPEAANATTPDQAPTPASTQPTPDEDIDDDDGDAFATEE